MENEKLFLLSNHILKIDEFFKREKDFCHLLLVYYLLSSVIILKVQCRLHAWITFRHFTCTACYERF